MAYTFDKDLAVDTLELIKETLLTVMRRTSHINTVDDFYASEVGMILLDNERYHGHEGYYCASLF